MPIESIDFNQVINGIIAIVSALAGHYYGFAKGKIHAARLLADSVDDALADNTINEQEYASISKVLPFLLQKQ